MGPMRLIGLMRLMRLTGLIGLMVELVKKVEVSDPLLFALRGVENLHKSLFLRTFAPSFRESYVIVNDNL